MVKAEREIPYDELSSAQLEQQDAVDNAIKDMLVRLGIVSEDWWDIEYISQITDAIQDAFHMSEREKYEFYPWLTGGEYGPPPEGKGMDDRFPIKPYKGPPPKAEPPAPVMLTSVFFVKDKKDGGPHG